MAVHPHNMPGRYPPGMFDTLWRTHLSKLHVGMSYTATRIHPIMQITLSKQMMFTRIEFKNNSYTTILYRYFGIVWD